MISCLRSEEERRALRVVAHGLNGKAFDAYDRILLQMSMPPTPGATVGLRVKTEGGKFVLVKPNG